MRRRLSDAYEPSCRLSDAYDHNFKKKINFVIFGRFKRKNPRAVRSSRLILDRNVVVDAIMEQKKRRYFGHHRGFYLGRKKIRFLRHFKFFP